MCPDPDDDASAERDSDRTVIIESLRRVYSGFLSIDEAVVSYPRHDGSRQTVTRQSMERGDSVAVAIVDRRRRKIWLTEQFRYSTLSKDTGWIMEIPAGMIERDEKPDAAARREAFEETGFALTTLETIATLYVSPGGTSERVILFYATVDGRVQDLAAAEKERDPDEDIKLVEQNLDDFFDACRRGRVNDAKTLAAGLWILANRERLAL